MATYNHGAFIFYRVGSACQPMTPHQIEQFAQQHGMPSAIVPAYAGDRQQVSRAIGQVQSGLSRRGYVLTSIKTSQHEVVYGISEVVKDQRHERVDHTFADCVRWSDEGGNGAHVDGRHSIACEVDTAYQALRGKVCPGDWTASLTAYLLGDCQAQPMREDGRIYWAPSSTLPQVQALGGFLQAVGIALVICEVESSSVQVVQQAATEGLAEQLQTLQADVAAFDGQQKPSNYTARIGEITRLRARATAYQACLGIATEQVQAVLGTLETQVRGLLDVRQQTTVARTTGQAHSRPVVPTTAASLLEVPATTPHAPSAAPGPVQALPTLGTRPGIAAYVQQGFNW